MEDGILSKYHWLLNGCRANIYRFSQLTIDTQITDRQTEIYRQAPRTTQAGMQAQRYVGRQTGRHGQAGAQQPNNQTVSPGTL